MPQLELLAPAGNLTLGMAAVDHGADAVYIGANRFGARAAAGNPVRDIERLCGYAHFYRARVYVALNTLLFDNELEDARKLIWRLWDAGADALIVQDMGLLEMDLPPIPLFASTQTDNRTPEKVKFLEKSGFQRVILARELGLDAIAGIRAATDVDLEAFVHGALCVCYSGQCYMSAAIGGRSANRGACGQPCRLPWNLVTGQGKVLARDRYLLSLKDMDRSDHLASLAAAGITSFKIEGRLKDMAYVKNVTAFYRQKLDALLEGNASFEKASSGGPVFSFSPDPAKTFSRGTTDYFLTGTGSGEIHAMDSPKSRGEAIGKIDRIGPDWFTLKTGPENPEAVVSNGDGLCFVDDTGGFRGFRVNRADREGRLYPPGRNPMKKIPLKTGMAVFRNHNHAFVRQLAGETAARRLGLSLVFTETSGGIALAGTDEDGVRARVDLVLETEEARNPDRALETLKKQLGRLGDTPFELKDLVIDSRPLFVQAKVLNGLRRDLVSRLTQARDRSYLREEAGDRPGPVPYPGTKLDFRGNVANELAKAFYRKCGVELIVPAFEISPPEKGGHQVMTTRHCIRRSLGACPGETGKALPEGPLFLENDRGRFQVEFNCRACEMNILAGTP
jgi:collagenase-like PrtC family protease